MVVTDLGILIDVNEEHARKAPTSIDNTESGITIAVNKEHP